MHDTEDEERCGDAIRQEGFVIDETARVSTCVHGWAGRTWMNSLLVVREA